MTGVIWQSAPVERLLMQEWDGESVVFDGCSGDTHLLDLVGTSVLRGLRAGIATREDLAAFVASELQLEPSSGLLAGVDETLATFERLRLAEPVLR